MTPTGVWSLHWADVDPSRRPFDEAEVRRFVERVLRERRLDVEDDEERELVEEEIDRALMFAFGAWIAGWQWTACECGCGGPVGTWCCPVSNTGHATSFVDDIVVAVRDWRDFLVELRGLFLDQLGSAKDLPVDEQAMRAASQILPLIVRRTGAEDAWYDTFQQALAWFLEMQLGDVDEARNIAARVVSGRFHSWLEPSEPAQAAAFEELGRSLRERHGKSPDPPEDSLQAWKVTRQSVTWRNTRIYTPSPVARDGHSAYIERFDAQCDESRAARMAAALSLARSAARSGEALNLDRLTEWQRVVLGTDDVQFRTSDAYSHGGRERYGIDGATRAEFERCLSEASSEGVLSVVRAARVYLDVCFFHPFPDGNGRAARLALDYVLTASNLALHAAEPVFIVARSARDECGFFPFINVIDYLAGPRANEL